MVQWLRLCTSTVGGVGSIPGQGTKILHAAQPKKKKNVEKIWKLSINLTLGKLYSLSKPLISVCKKGIMMLNSIFCVCL